MSEPDRERPLRYDANWDGARVRALRSHIGETQREFADRIGTNQQTVSGWEREARRPRRMARRLLHLVAEQAAFYELREGSAAGPPAPDSPAPDSPPPGLPAPDSPAPDSPAPDSPAPDSPAAGSPPPREKADPRGDR